MTLSESQRHFTRLLAGLLVYADGLPGYDVVLDSAARSAEEQARLVKAGASKTIDSAHVRRLAADLILFRDGKLTWNGDDYEPLGVYWKSLDTRCAWGGDWDRFRDYGHFEFKHEPSATEET